MSWDDVLGQERAVSTLRGDLEGRLPHALLLFGPKGVGKALAARTLAETLLCESASACGECLSCGKVGRETHPDFLRLAPVEGKRWITVGQVRSAIDWMQHQPLEGERRVIVIDPSEMLRVEAANALLKTLEEPPPYGLLILLAESPAALPETVVSRCRPVRFRPLGEDPLREILRREGVDPSRIDAAVRLGRGSVGRAITFAREGGEETYRFLLDVLRDLGEEETPGAVRSVLEHFEGDRERVAEALEMIGQLYRDRLVDDIGAGDLAALPGEAAPGTSADDLLRAFPILWRSRDDVAAFVDPGLVLQRAFWEIRQVAVP